MHSYLNYKIDKEINVIIPKTFYFSAGFPISHCFIIPITCSVSRIAPVCVWGWGDANPQKGCTNQLFGQIFLEKLHEDEI